MWGGTNLKIRGQSLYTLPAGTPVGIDKVTGQFAPVVSSHLSTYSQTIHSSASIAGICRVSDTYVALFLTSAAALEVVAFTVSSGHAVTYGTPVSIGAANLGGMTIVDAAAISAIDTNKFVVVFSNSANSSFQTAVVGTVSGTTITLGSLTVLVSTAGLPQCCPLGSNRFVAMVKTAGSEVGFIACTVSGTTITAGSSVNTPDVGLLAGLRHICEAAANTFVAVYYSSTADVRTRVVAGTVSGTTITLGSSVRAENVGISGMARIASAGANSFLVTYYDSTTTASLRRCAGTVSGTTVTLGAPTTPTGITALSAPPQALAAISNTSYLNFDDASSMAQCVITNVSGTTIITTTPRDSTLLWATTAITAICPFRDGMFLFLMPVTLPSARNTFAPVIIAPESVHLRVAGILEMNVTAGALVNAVIRGAVETQFNNQHRLPLMIERSGQEAAGDVLRSQPITAANDARTIPRQFVWLSNNRIWANFT